MLGNKPNELFNIENTEMVLPTYINKKEYIESMETISNDTERY